MCLTYNLGGDGNIENHVSFFFFLNHTLQGAKTMGLYQKLHMEKIIQEAFSDSFYICIYFNTSIHQMTSHLLYQLEVMVSPVKSQLPSA